MATTQIRGYRQILALSIQTGQIADVAITTAKIADAAVTTVKIAGGAVTIDKLNDFRPSAGTGLVLNVASGSVRLDNVVSTYAGGTLTLTDASTNYVEVNTAGTVSFNTTGFTAGRFPIATVTTVAGAITVVADNRSIVSFDTTSSNNFSTREVPTGTINGVNDTFTLAHTPVSGSEEVYLNGVQQQSGGADYAITTNSIVFVSGAIPQTGDRVLVTYRY